MDRIDLRREGFLKEWITGEVGSKPFAKDGTEDQLSGQINCRNDNQRKL